MARLRLTASALLVALAALLSLSAAAQAQVRHHGAPSRPVSARAVSQSLTQMFGSRTASQVTAENTCPQTKPGYARCDVEVLASKATHRWLHPKLQKAYSPDRTVTGPSPLSLNPAGGPFASPFSGSAASPLFGAGGATTSEALPQSGTPAFLQQAYDLSYLSATGGGGQTVGIVDAYSDPTAASDLAAYRSEFNLPPCTTANGCLTIHDETTTTNSGWTGETSLDLDMVSAICPQCHIVLVSTSDNSTANLDAGIAEAKTLGATQISNSWGVVSPTATGSSPNPGGVNVFASAGDSGYGAPDGTGNADPQWPAAYSDITAVGGTALTYDPTTARGYDESAWLDSGSGCDPNQSTPSYQTGADPGCAGRAYNDISAEADPNTGVVVYETVSGTGGNYIFGGTSASSPMTAAFEALLGTDNVGPAWAYQNAGKLNDIVSGTNSDPGESDPACTSDTRICNAQTGFDGPTGNGSISGAVATGAPGIGSNGSGAQSVTGTTYPLSAGVYPNGADTTVSVQYGPVGGGYTNTTATQDVGAGTAPVSVSFTLTGLTAGTDYHYRVVATNSYGTTYGYDNDIAAPANAPTITSLSTSAVTRTTATVSYSGDLYGSGGYEVVYQDETANSTAQNTAEVFGSGPFSGSVTLTGLAPDSAYHVYLATVNSVSNGSGGTTSQYANSPTKSFETAPAVTAVTTGANTSSSTSATLTGTANNEGDATGTYYFEYGTTTSYGSTTATTKIDAGGATDGTDTAVSAAVSGLAPNTTYHYALVATANGQTVTSADATFTTPPAATVSAPSATVADATDATVSYTANAEGNPGTTTYVAYGTTASYGLTTSSATVTGSSDTSESVSLSGLSPNTTYFYEAVVTNSVGTVTRQGGSFTTPQGVGEDGVSASATDPNDATLSGNANAYGNPGTTAYFIYGPTSGYGSQTSAQTVSGTTDQPISASVSNLTPSTTYHYAMVVTSPYGTVQSADQTFTTPAAASAGGVSATTSDSGDATVTGAADNEGWSGTTAYFQYGTSSSYGQQTSAQAVTGTDTTLQASLAGLAANTTYHYRLVVTNAYGTARSADQTFTTPAAGSIGTVTAAAKDSGSETLDGAFNANGNPNTTLYYEYGTTASYGNQTSARALSSGDDQVTLTGLSPNTTYHYALVLTNSYGTITSPDQTFTTAPAAAASAPSSSNIGITTATVSATANAEGNSGTTYSFEYGKTSSYGSQTASTQISGTSDQTVSADLNSLSADTTYHYALVVTNSYGTATTQDGTFTTDAAGSVSQLNATVNSPTDVTVTGTADGAGVADTYAYFEYGTTSSYGQQTNATVLSSGQTQAVSAELTGLTPSTTYHYALVVTNADGTVTSEDQTFTTPAQVPSADGLSATALSASSETIQGTANANGINGATATFVYGPTTSYGQRTATASVPVGGPVPLSATLTGLTPATTYHYQLVITANGQTATSSDGTFTTLPVATIGSLQASSSSDSTATLAAVAATNGESATAHFAYGTTVGYGQSSQTVQLNANGSQTLTVNLTGLAPDTTYHYTLVVATADGTVTGQDETFTTPSAPSGGSGATTPGSGSSGSGTATSGSGATTTQGSGSGSTPSKPPVAVTTTKAAKPVVKRVARHGDRFAVTVACHGTVSCRLRLKVLERAPHHLSRVLVTRTVTIHPGKTQTVRLMTKRRVARKARLSASVAVRRGSRWVAVKR